VNLTTSLRRGADPRQALSAFGDRLRELGWVTDLWVAGSLATGDHVPGVSDVDLVAVVDTAWIAWHDCRRTVRWAASAPKSGVPTG
jgi:hypothetical protein